VLFLASEPLHPSLTGPARRALKLAEVVAERCEVTLAAPAPSRFPDGPFRTVETGPVNDQRLGPLMARHDVTVLQMLPSPRQIHVALRSAPRLVVDMIAPFALEVSEIGADDAERASMVRWRTRELLAHLAAADLVLSSNEKQRDLLLGAGLAAGLLDRGGWQRPLQERLGVVPHGLDPEPHRSGGSPLRGAGLVGEGERLAVWGGGMWSWLDPLTAVRALERLRPQRPDLKLAFVGFEHPDPATRRAHAAVSEATIAYARDHGLGDAVLFRPQWLDRQQYLDHLGDADVGLALHGETLEGRFASRTRVLDYLAAGLPVLCSRGDTMSELVAAHGLGAVVEPLDVDGCARALDELTRGERRRIDRSVLAPLFWPNAARPLLDYLADPGPPAARPQAASLTLAARSYPDFLRAVYGSGGARELVAAARRRLAR
jgi:glycosyltransferase involved in cell wall biosynthesis